LAQATNAQNSLASRVSMGSDGGLVVLVGRGVGAYLCFGFALHTTFGVLEFLRTLVFRRPWPNVELKQKRLSDGAPSAPEGEGHEVYQYDTPWNAYAAFKLLLALATGLLPVRLGIFTTCFMSNVFAMAAGARLPKGSFLRRCAERQFAWGCKGLSMSCACYAFEIYGAEHLKWVRKPGQHPIICPNHISLVEVFNLHWLTGGMSGVMAKSQLSIPFMSTCVGALDLVIIDPKDPENKEKVKALIRKFTQNEAEGKIHPFSRAFTIYPEGVTSGQFGLWRFNLGAFEPGVTVLPCVQRFPYKHYNPGWVSNSKLNPGNDLPMMLLWCMSQFTIPYQVKFLPPWEPSDAELKDAALFANNMQNYMAVQLGCKKTATSYKLLREKDGPFDMKSKGVRKTD